MLNYVSVYPFSNIGLLMRYTIILHLANKKFNNPQIAFLLNYFWLCQLFWMVVEAVTMYRALVKVFGTAVDKALLKYSIVGWGVPMLFPLIGLTWAKVTQYADPKTLVLYHRT